MAREGVRLAITARRRDRLEDVAAAIAAEGLELPIAIDTDLTDEDAPRLIHDAVETAIGPLEILANNAGGSTPMTTDVSDDEWESSFALNFTAARRLTVVMLPDMRSGGWGRIIIISGTMEPDRSNAAQAASATTQARAKGLSRDVAADGITVNCIPPGRINSEQIRERLHLTQENRKAFIDQNIPVGYFGDPEDIGYLVAFLASPLARYITGTVIYVDGGMHRFVH